MNIITFREDDISNAVNSTDIPLWNVKEILSVKHCILRPAAEQDECFAM
jgi:hypothetical protein